jgi:hypothetical protein
VKITRFIPTPLEISTADGASGLVELVDWTQPTPQGTAVVVGVGAGEAASIIVETGEFQCVYCVDTWNRPGGVLTEKYYRARQLSRPRLWTLKMASVHAAKAIEDDSVDLVYLNAIESNRQLARDLRLWIPKVRRRGVIAGVGYRTTPPPAPLKAVLRRIPPKLVKGTVSEFFEEVDVTFIDGSWAVRCQ